MKKYLSVYLTVALLNIAAVPFCAAQQAVDTKADQLKAAKELLVAAGSAKQFDTVIPFMIRQMEVAFIKLKPEHEAIIKAVFDLIPERFSERKQELLDQIAQLYAARFSTEELHALRDFYLTPVGKKFVDSQGELVQQSMVLGQAWGQRIGQQIGEEVRKELKQRGVTL